MAIDVVVPATHAAESVPASTSTAAAVPASAIVVCIAASACVSKLLAYYATLSVSLVFFARAAWPDLVDAVLLVPLDAHARRAALLARADLEADLTLIREAAARAHPAAEAVFAAAEELARVALAAVAGWASAARRKAEAKWSGVIDGIRTPAPRVKGEEEVVDARFELYDVVSLVEIGFFILCTIRLIFRLNNSSISGMPFWTACLAATCGLLVLVDDWIDPPDDEDDADETDEDDADDVADTVTTQHGEETLTVDVEVEVRESWRFVRGLIFAAYCADALYLHVMLGPQPIAVALLALCNFGVLNVGRRVELSPDDGEGAVDRWRRGAIAVFVASTVKVFAFVVINLVHEFYVGPPPPSLALLGVMGSLLLDEEDCLLGLVDVSGDDEDGEEDGGDAGSSEDITGGVEEGGDEEESSASSSENEEESRVLEEHCDISEDYFIPKGISEDHERPKEELQEEGIDEAKAAEHSNASSSEDEEESSASSLDEEEESRALEEHCDISEDHEHPKEEEQKEGIDEAKAGQHSNASSSEDEEEANASSSENEEGSRSLEEHCDISEDHFIQKDISEGHEHPKEEEQEEPEDCSSGGSMNDGWDLVELDPEMRDKDTSEANPMSRLFPWKHAA